MVSILGRYQNCSDLQVLDQLWTFANVANSKWANVRDTISIQAIPSVQVEYLSGNDIFKL